MSEASVWEDWPLSNNFILAAILLLLATAGSLVVATEALANQLARYAYYALVVGVLLRFIEMALEERDIDPWQWVRRRLAELR